MRKKHNWTWEKVAEYVGDGLVVAQCYRKWRNISATSGAAAESTPARQTRSRFTPQHDALILKRIAEMGINAGTWKALETELGFSETSIRGRYVRLAVGTSNLLFFTPKMVHSDLL